jgi:dihydrofolate reductase
VPAGGVYTFVRSPREAAEVAIGLAGMDVFSASIGGQLLRAGLVDEVRLHLAPVLLGAGTRLLDDDDGHTRLQLTRITESSKATHRRYRVLAVDGTG